MCFVCCFASSEGKKKSVHHRRHRSCKTLYDAGKWIPVGLIGALFIYSYYVYVAVFSTQFLLYRLKRQVQSGLYIAFYHLLMIPTLICFTRCVIADPGEAVKYKLIAKDDAERLAVQEVANVQEEDREVIVVDTPRYCGICQQPKPERAHHCSECNTCVLKMDHHCVMLNNCVGFATYKLFILMNCYAILFCAFLAATLLQILIWQLVEGKLIGNSIQFLIICVYAFGLGFCCIALVSLHFYLIYHNRTTIEQIQYKDLKKEGELTDDWYGYKYDLGLKENWRQVFGENPLLWFIPHRNAKGNGAIFPKNE